jgi:hypothetical protein
MDVMGGDGLPRTRIHVNIRVKGAHDQADFQGKRMIRLIRGDGGQSSVSAATIHVILLASRYWV